MNEDHHFGGITDLEGMRLSSDLAPSRGGGGPRGGVGEGSSHSPRSLVFGL